MVKRDRWARFRYMPCLPLGKDGRRVTGSEAHRVLARTAAEHGMVLLKNGGMLPLRHGSPVAVFGKGQTDFVKGGGGSGDVTSDPAVSLLEGLRNKEKQGKLTLLPSLGELYPQNTLEQYDRGVLPGKPVSRNSRRLCLSRRQNGRIRRCLLSAGMPEKKSTTRTSRETTGFLQQNRSCSIR